jgi:hypothetical protein
MAVSCCLANGNDEEQEYEEMITKWIIIIVIAFIPAEGNVKKVQEQVPVFFNTEADCLIHAPEYAMRRFQELSTDEYPDVAVGYKCDEINKTTTEETVWKI